MSVHCVSSIWYDEREQGALTPGTIHNFARNIIIVKSKAYAILIGYCSKSPGGRLSPMIERKDLLANKHYGS